MPTPDPSVLPIAVWVTGMDPTVVTDTIRDVLLVGFGVLSAFLAAILVVTGLRPGR